MQGCVGAWVRVEVGVWEECRGGGSVEMSQRDLETAQLVTCLWPWWKKQSSHQGKRWHRAWDLLLCSDWTTNISAHLANISIFSVIKVLSSLPPYSSKQLQILPYIHLLCQELLFFFIQLILNLSFSKLLRDWAGQQWYIIQPTRWSSGIAVTYKSDQHQHFSPMTNAPLILLKQNPLLLQIACLFSHKVLYFKVLLCWIYIFN